MRKDGQGRVYFVDHNTRTTTWHDPRKSQAPSTPASSGANATSSDDDDDDVSFMPHKLTPHRSQKLSLQDAKQKNVSNIYKNTRITSTGKEDS